MRRLAGTSAAAPSARALADLPPDALDEEEDRCVQRLQQIRECRRRQRLAYERNVEARLRFEMQSKAGQPKKAPPPAKSPAGKKTTALDPGLLAMVRDTMAGMPPGTPQTGASVGSKFKEKHGKAFSATQQENNLGKTHKLQKYVDEILGSEGAGPAASVAAGGDDSETLINRVIKDCCQVGAVAAQQGNPFARVQQREWRHSLCSLGPTEQWALLEQRGLICWFCRCAVPRLGMTRRGRTRWWSTK